MTLAEYTIREFAFFLGIAIAVTGVLATSERRYRIPAWIAIAVGVAMVWTQWGTLGVAIWGR